MDLVSSRSGLAAPDLPDEGDGWRPSVRILVATSWISSAIFAIFIFALYGGAISAGAPDDWNATLPRLYVAGSTGLNAAIGVHFLLGAILLLLGPVQLIGSVRRRWPRVHRWVGWTYAPAAFLTGLGGCLYIIGRGTVGGTEMTAAFLIYGGSLMVCAGQTVRFALRRDFASHRAWAIRLFALAVGSWLYRMDYGFWTMLLGHAGRTGTFDGPFDRVMDFWFYLPNLLVAELAIRRGRRAPGRAAASATAFLAASLFIAAGTFFFTWKSWGPTILWRMGLIS